MAKIDIDKFICDFIGRTQYRHLITEVQDALKEQGLEYKSGQIVEIIPTIEEEIPNETKFKIGDLVVFNEHHNSLYQIEKIENYEYTLRHILGGSMPLSFSHESNIRLWTIQDAKDGDVLYISTDTRSIHAIFQKYENGIVYFHCYLCGNFSEGGYEPIGGIENISPLPQHQHKERFFRKMAEAGYEWDAENKELRKIEKPDIDNTNGNSTIKFEAEPKEGLTAFEKKVKDLLGYRLPFGEQDVKEEAQILLSIARKQLAEEELEKIALWTIKKKTKY